MSIEQNKTLVRRFFEEGLSTGNMAVLETMLDANFTLHGAPPMLPPGREGFKLFIGMFRTAFPDYKDTVEDLFAEGDKVVARWTFRGTHAGEFQGIPPTQKQVTTTGISIFRVVGGKITDDWTTVDMLGLLQQIGAMPVS
jgi:steroid delta-isomerase-like uncharacterized protein